MINHEEYFKYLQGRSRLGLLYRKHWLYPRLAHYVRGRVLDVGCGIGDLLGLYPNAVGVDVNQDAVAWCLTQGFNARLMVPDQLPFANASFDGVMLDNVLEHLQRPMPLLAEIRRVLVTGGVLVVGVPGRRGFDCDPDHKVFYDQKSLVNVLTQAGFNVERVFHMPFHSIWLEGRLRQYCIYGVFHSG